MSGFLTPCGRRQGLSCQILSLPLSCFADKPYLHALQPSITDTMKKKTLTIIAAVIGVIALAYMCLPYYARQA